MRLKAGSLQPPMTIELLDNGSKITGLDTALSVRMVAEFAADTAFIDDASPDIDAAAGTVTHQWVSGETDERGRLFWTVIVDFGDGAIYFPPRGEEVTDIE